MEKNLFLAIDIGTTNSKGAIISSEGEIIAATSCRHTVSHPQPGWAEHDADQIWWNEFTQICKALLTAKNVSAHDIVSVGISSLSPAVLPIDASGNALAPAMLYGLDRRAVQEIKDLEDVLGAQYSLDENLRSISPLSPAPKILWLKRNMPEVFKQTAYFISAVPFLVYRLTGKAVVDYGSYKVGGFPFSFMKFGWDQQACDACGITPDQLPELKFATEQAGTITAEAAKSTGLLPGTPVAVGTGDSLAEYISCGTQFIGLPQISFGTCIGVNNGNDRGAILFKDYQVSIKDEMLPGGAMSNGCATIDWVISMISGAESKGRISNDSLTQMAKSVPAGSNGITILPYFNGEKKPFTDPQAKGMIFGLRMGHTHADLYKAVLESAAYSIRHMLIEGTNEKALVMGGGTKIPNLLQTVSDVTGLHLHVLENSNGALIGDAFIAGMACGMFSNREEINTWVNVSEIIEPGRDFKPIYDNGFEIYKELYNATADIMHK